MSLHISVLLAASLTCGASAAKPAPEPAPLTLPGEGRSCELPGGMHFTYRFSSRPQMGTVVLKVQIFNADGSRAKDIRILARSGMPSMGGAHDSDDKPFQLMEHERMRRIGRIGSIDLAGTDNSKRRFMLFHEPCLHRRRMTTQ